MKFHNRNTELEELERIWGLCSVSSHFTILTGRRRVGKTELVKQFYANKPHLYFFIGRKKPVLLLEELSEVARTGIKDFPTIVKFDEWLKFLLNNAEPGTVIFIDEFQNFKFVDDSIFSDFQKVIDEYKNKVQLHIIAAGSHITLMDKIFADSKEPLFGRATEKYVLNPMQFKDISKMLSDIGITNIESQIHWYSIFGGIPKYYVMAEEQGLSGMDIFSALKILLFRDFAPLKEEARSVLTEEFGREHPSFFSILEAVALGNSEMTTIADRSGIKVKSITKYLGQLVKDFRYLDYEVPVTEASPWKSKKGRYFLNDNFFKFWFRYIYRNRSDYEIGNYDKLIDKIQRDFESFVGREFEKISIQYLKELNTRNKLPFTFSKIGRWWRKGYEIDIIATDDNSKKILFGECKWQNRKTGIDVLATLMDKSRFVDWNINNRTEYFVVISKSGFTKKAEEFAGQNNVILDTLQDFKNFLDHP
ncbi:MAG: ATP-binding protein [ANME-2 cluster archaeon]|jgi:AAA+ ATPase superfamily predicted ATPase|nr:ATP-binding protein [ANME-2 cluster archaeon]